MVRAGRLPRQRRVLPHGGPAPRGVRLPSGVERQRACRAAQGGTPPPRRAVESRRGVDGRVRRPPLRRRPLAHRAALGERRRARRQRSHPSPRRRRPEVRPRRHAAEARPQPPLLLPHREHRRRDPASDAVDGARHLLQLQRRSHEASPRPAAKGRDRMAAPQCHPQAYAHPRRHLPDARSHRERRAQQSHLRFAAPGHRRRQRCEESRCHEAVPGGGGDVWGARDGSTGDVAEQTAFPRLHRRRGRASRRGPPGRSDAGAPAGRDRLHPRAEGRGPHLHAAAAAQHRLVDPRLCPRRQLGLRRRIAGGGDVDRRPPGAVARAPRPASAGRPQRPQAPAIGRRRPPLPPGPRAHHRHQRLQRHGALEPRAPGLPPLQRAPRL